MKIKADIAVVGLAVMGENLILNMESKGFTVDSPRGMFFHTNWTGRGGATSSSTYDV